MRDAGRRPMGRLLYWALIVVAGFGLSALPCRRRVVMATTTVADTVYLADGTAASGDVDHHVAGVCHSRAGRRSRGDRPTWGPVTEWGA